VIDGKLKLKHASAADSDMNKNKKHKKCNEVQGRQIRKGIETR